MAGLIKLEEYVEEVGRILGREKGFGVTVQYHEKTIELIFTSFLPRMTSKQIHDIEKISLAAEFSSSSLSSIVLEPSRLSQDDVRIVLTRSPKRGT